jgi:ubiquinone biosynthesis protein COQ9
VLTSIILDSAALLQRAFTLVPAHGFTRQTLALAGSSTASAAPLTDTSITALFGPGDDARRAFIQAWLDDATKQSISETPAAVVPPSTAALKQALASRLHANTPVLHHLSEAFGLLSAPDMRIAGRTLPAFPVLDPRAGLTHAWRVADRACVASGLGLDGTEWYARRTAVAGAFPTACVETAS